jgi:hypothetical protein
VFNADPIPFQHLCCLHHSLLHRLIKQANRLLFIELHHLLFDRFDMKILESHSTDQKLWMCQKVGEAQLPPYKCPWDHFDSSQSYIYIYIYIYICWMTCQAWVTGFKFQCLFQLVCKKSNRSANSLTARSGFSLNMAIKKSDGIRYMTPSSSAKDNFQSFGGFYCLGDIVAFCR